MAVTLVARRSRGFTLIELMITILVLAIVSAIALPNFSRMIRNNRVTSQTNELIASLSLARMEAIRANASVVGNRDVVLCPSTNGTSCSTGWSSGWIVATRLDDTIQTVLRHSQQPLGVTVTGAGTEIVFDNRGRRVSGPASLLLQSDHCVTGEPYLRTVTINASGQVRVTPGNCP